MSMGTTGAGMWASILLPHGRTCGQSFPAAVVVVERVGAVVVWEGGEQGVPDAKQSFADSGRCGVVRIVEEVAADLGKQRLGFGPMVDPVIHQVTPFCRSTSSA
jgi:hypothetical protein